MWTSDPRSVASCNRRITFSGSISASHTCWWCTARQCVTCYLNDKRWSGVLETTVASYRPFIRPASRRQLSARPGCRWCWPSQPNRGECVGTSWPHKADSYTDQLNSQSITTPVQTAGWAIVFKLEACSEVIEVIVEFASNHGPSGSCSIEAGLVHLCFATGETFPIQRSGYECPAVKPENPATCGISIVIMIIILTLTAEYYRKTNGNSFKHRCKNIDPTRQLNVLFFCSFSFDVFMPTVVCVWSKSSTQPHFR